MPRADTLQSAVQASRSELLAGIDVLDASITFEGNACFTLFDGRYTRVRVVVEADGCAEVRVDAFGRLDPLMRRFTTVSFDGVRRFSSPSTWFKQPLPLLCRRALARATEVEARLHARDGRAVDVFTRAAAALVDAKRIGNGLQEAEQLIS